MELDITHMMDDADEMPMLSGSVAELGQDAGRITWRNSLAYAAKHPLLVDADAMEKAREYFAGYGAWDMKEQTDADVQGLTVQEVASAIREMERFATPEEYEAAAEDGSTSRNVYRGDNGRWYFYLGS